MPDYSFVIPFFTDFEPSQNNCGMVTRHGQNLYISPVFRPRSVRPGVPLIFLRCPLPRLVVSRWALGTSQPPDLDAIHLYFLWLGYEILSFPIASGVISAGFSVTPPSYVGIHHLWTVLGQGKEPVYHTLFCVLHRHF